MPEATIARLKEAYWEWMLARQARYDELMADHIPSASATVFLAHTEAVKQINTEQLP